MYIPYNYNEQDSENNQYPLPYHEQNEYMPTHDYSCKKPRKGKSVLAAACLCLCFCVAGGIIGYSACNLLPSASGVNSTTDLEQKNTVILNRPITEYIPTAVSGNSAELSTSQIYSTYVNAVVGISTEGTTVNIFGQTTKKASSGAGFLISSDGYIVTNYHVIEDATSVKVTLYSGESYDAEIVGYESDNDVAVLKIAASGLNTVKTGSSSSLVVGETICTIGHPLNELTYSLTRGVVSALGREINIDGDPINMFQIDASVNSGNSGGPVFNSRGEVIGIVTAKYSDSGVEGIGFAIPIDDIADMVNQIIDHGYVSGKPYLGVSIQTSGSPSGAYLTVIADGSCIQKAGLLAGDIIVSVDNTQIASSDDLITVKQNYKPGDKATIRAYRNGELMVFTVVFDEQTPERVSALTEAVNEYSKQMIQSSNQYNTNPYSGYYYSFPDFFGNGSYYYGR